MTLEEWVDELLFDARAYGRDFEGCGSRAQEWEDRSANWLILAAWAAREVEL